MKNGHGNIAIFVPHIGCPRRCSFCDQNTISGAITAPTPNDVANACRLAALKGGSKELELAFFGGSFTAIDRPLMVSLLQAASPFVGNLLSGIRISTRPDCIDKEILTLLKNYGVTSIELGSQSMCDEVLALNNRGHKAADTINASHLIKEYGFSLGLQMMTGLYSSSKEQDIFTAKEIIKLSPDTVRIYPTITIKNTALALFYNEGKYLPPTLEETVSLCADLTIMFNENGIRVIKTGLHPSQELESKMVAGPYHQAFGELCQSEIMKKRLLPQLKNIPKGEIKVGIAKGETSKFIGQKRKNLLYFKSLGYDIKLIEDSNINSLFPQLYF